MRRDRTLALAGVGAVVCHMPRLRFGSANDGVVTVSAVLTWRSVVLGWRWTMGRGSSILSIARLRRRGVVLLRRRLLVPAIGLRWRGTIRCSWRRVWGWVTVGAAVR